MSANSHIQWTDNTDNIIVVIGGGWWCLMISEGCVNCYAARINQNIFYGGNGLAYTGQPPPLVLREDILAGWARQTRPRLHFVASMTDVFGKWVSREWQFAMFDAMAAAPLQIFQVLTKRPENFAQAATAWCAARGVVSLPENIWAGVSVENQQRADERRESLRAIPVRCMFVSYEPALGPVDWSGWEFVSQIISGGESGPKARPSHPDWHRATRDFCAANGSAYFFKQWGEWLPGRDVADVPDHEPKKIIRLALDGTQGNEVTMPSEKRPGMKCMCLVGKRVAGRALDGREHSAFPATDHPALKGRETLRA